MSCPGSFVCKTSVGISDKSSPRSDITFFIYDLPGYFGEVFFDQKMLSAKIGVLRICKPPSLMCSIPQHRIMAKGRRASCGTISSVIK